MPTEYQAQILKLDLPEQESLKNDANGARRTPPRCGRSDAPRPAGSIVRADSPG